MPTRIIRQGRASLKDRTGRYFISLILLSQRSSWLLPKAIRGYAKRIVGRFLAQADYESLLEDWSTPLVGKRVAPSDVDILALAKPNSAAAAGLKIQQSANALRCLLITRTLNAGGVDEFVAFLARQLPAWNFDVKVMCASSLHDRAQRGELARTLECEGISVVDGSTGNGRQLLDEIRPDVISAHDPPDWVLEIAPRLGIPIVETLHGVPTPIGTDWQKESIRSQNITAIVAVSEFVRQLYLRGNPNYSSKSIVTIPNAFNTAHRPAIDRTMARAWLGLDDEFLFVSLGRHVIQKNAYGLVAAFADVARVCPRAHLVIAGPLQDRFYTEQVILLRDGLPERGRIHLRDNLSRPSVILAAADGFVLNSFFEGWPLASMEALCAGLPVVMSEVGGASEQVGINGERGFVVSNPLGDPCAATWDSASRERFRPQVNKAALTAAMISIINNREHWASIRDTLAAESRERFSARGCAELHAEVLVRAAGRRPPFDNGVSAKVDSF
jgi:glycosyltransferase involved in cell wall biosynthesis